MERNGKEGPEIRRPAGILVLVILIAASGFACTPRGEAPGGPVVLVILDTVRADHLGVDGYRRDTSPNLDRLAGEGEYYRNAWAQSPWTLPSIATLLTGQPPRVHGAGWVEGRLYPVRPETETLAGRLRRRGYRTGAVMNVVFCSPRSGLDRGFEHYDFRTTDASNRGHRNARETTDAALEWVHKVRREPFLLVVHYFDAHLTYDPPAPLDTRFEPDDRDTVPPGFGSANEVVSIRKGRIALTPRQKISLVARYDGEIRFLDEQFGRLRRGLEELGVWDDALVAVVGDHGEEFWDHGGFEHGHTHHAELMRVPLILKRPGGPRGIVREGLARQLDVVPTVLHHAGPGPEEERLPGRTLDENGAAYSVGEGSFWSGELRSIRSQDGTLLLDRAGRPAAFYEAGDARERKNRIGDAADVAGRLEAVLAAIPTTDRSADRRWEPDAGQREQLRSLGYLE